MTPSYKADQVRKLFKANHDWTGRVFPWWVGADKVPLTDDDLEKLKDIAFGTCTNCRRCTFNCPMGVDTATLNRIMRGLLTPVGVMPEGVRVVSKDQWEIGNQMGVLKEDYLDTLEWMSEELEEDLGHDEAAIPIDKKGAKVMYCHQPARGEVRPADHHGRGADLLRRRRELDHAQRGLGQDQLRSLLRRRRPRRRLRASGSTRRRASSASRSSSSPSAATATARPAARAPTGRATTEPVRDGELGR